MVSACDASGVLQRTRIGLARRLKQSIVLALHFASKLISSMQAYLLCS